MLMGAPDLQVLLSSHTMITDFIRTRGGEEVSTVVSLGIAFAIINANIATIVLVGRQVYSTGRDHVWSPRINHAFTQVHSRFHSPWLATLIPGALAAAACFIGLDALLIITGTSLVVVYASLCVAVIAGRRSGKTSHGIYRMPLYPLPPIAGLCALAYVIYANYLDADVGRPSLIATGGMMTLAAGYYLAVLRRRGAWKPRDPLPEIES
jgi:amino acid transporter